MKHCKKCGNPLRTIVDGIFSGTEICINHWEQMSYNKREEKMKQSKLKFYRECLKNELRKPFNKQDSMYLIHLDEVINKIKTKLITDVNI